jgi:hypothetical protein
MTNDPAWVAQKGQCSICCITFSAGGLLGDPGSTDTNLEPLTEQISTNLPLLLTADNAWDIEGASILNSIAKHAIQIFSVLRFKNLPIL